MHPEVMGTTPEELHRAYDVLKALENAERTPDAIEFVSRTPDGQRADGFAMHFAPTDDGTDGTDSEDQ